MKFVKYAMMGIFKKIIKLFFVQDVIFQFINIVMESQ